jgi:hypothetical protein
MNTQWMEGFVEGVIKSLETDHETISTELNFGYAVKETEKSFRVEWECDNLRDTAEIWGIVNPMELPETQRADGYFIWLKSEPKSKLVEYITDMVDEVVGYDHAPFTLPA